MRVLNRFLGMGLERLDGPFDQALGLSLALQSCLHAINRYNRSTTKGKSMGVLFSIKLDSQAISVIEAPVKDHGNGAAQFPSNT